MLSLWGLALLSLLGGCGERIAPVHPVRGQVLLDGLPLEGADVAFHPQVGEGRNLTATTNADGRFELTTHAPGDGAEAGKYGVSIQWRELVQEGDEASRAGKNLLPPRYADPATSQLEAEVREGTNELPPWDLSSR